MLHKNLSKLALITAMLGASPVFAGQFSTNTVTVAPAGTVVVTVSFAGDGATVDAQMDLDFDNTDLTVSAPTIVGAGSVCTIIDTNTVRVIPPSGGAVPLPGAPTAACSFTFTAGNPAVLPDVNSFTINATAPNECTSLASTVPCTLSSGTITIQSGPAPSFAPNTQAAINITDPIGGGATTATFTVTNDGQAGSTLNVLAPTGLSGVLSVAPASAQAIAQGAAGTTYTISCAATADAPDTQTISFDHDGTANGGEADPFTFQVTCDGAVVNTPGSAALGTVTQPTGGGAAAGTTATGSVAFTVASAGVATASTLMTCTIPVTAPSNFTITSNGTQTLTAPIASVGTVGVTCVRQAAAVSATMTCTQVVTPAGTNPANITQQIDCPAGTTAPNPSVAPASGSTINLTSGLNVASPPSNVVFSNVGSAPAVLPYDVTCSTAAPYAVTPTTAQTVNPGATATVGVTCTPTTLGAQAAGTLTCTSGTAGVGPFTFPLACTGVATGPIPSLGDMGKLMLIALTLGLGLMGFAFRRNA